MFEHYVGEVVPYFAGVPELPVFSIHGSKALVKVFYNSPTAEEIEQFDAGKSFADNNLIEFIPVENADHRFQNPACMELATKRVLEFFDF